jgi:hypothetical protein
MFFSYFRLALSPQTISIPFNVFICDWTLFSQTEQFCSLAATRFSQKNNFRVTQDFRIIVSLVGPSFPDAKVSKESGRY